jgi:hypothetical protein
MPRGPRRSRSSRIIANIIPARAVRVRHGLNARACSGRSPPGDRCRCYRSCRSLSHRIVTDDVGASRVVLRYLPLTEAPFVGHGYRRQEPAEQREQRAQASVHAGSVSQVGRPNFIWAVTWPRRRGRSASPVSFRSPSPNVAHAKLLEPCTLDLVLRSLTPHVSLPKQDDDGQRCPSWVMGGKTRDEYMFSELPQIADIVESAVSPRPLFGIEDVKTTRCSAARSAADVLAMRRRTSPISRKYAEDYAGRRQSRVGAWRYPRVGGKC